MNRILSITILLLTLLTAEEMRAQSMTNETTHNCDDGSFWYMTDLNCEEDGNGEKTCSSCGGVFKGDEIAEHEKNCFYECNKCKQKMKVIERDKHKCKGDEPEPDPDPKPDNDHKPESDPDKPDNPSGSGPKGIPDQVLPNITVNGKNKSSFNWWDWTYVIGGGGGGGNSSNNNSESTGTFAPEEQPLHAAQQSGEKTDSIGYHRCPCLITEATKKLLDNLKEHRLYNQDNGYPDLTKDLERQLAFPETIQQGNNGTCAAAALQKFLAENFPEKYAECVYNLANYGRYEPWGLKYDFLSKGGSPFGITQAQLDAENVRDDAKELGNQYTSVDAIMQSAIQSWANRNSKIERIYDNIVNDLFNLSFSLDILGTTFNTFGYDPRKDDGDVGGMTFRDVEKFITENIGDGSSIKYKNSSKSITYDYFNDALFKQINNDFDSYTVLASVDIVQNQNGKYFGEGKPGHLLEISGTKSGKIDFWSYGNNYTTSESNCPIGELMIIMKTDYAKKEKKDKQFLTCHCNDCSGDGSKCNSCMSK